MTDDEIQAIALRAANGSHGNPFILPTTVCSADAPGPGRAPDPGGQHATGEIAVLIQERQQLRSAITAALKEYGWTEQAIGIWLAELDTKATTSG